jgi:hypothetical protein
MGGQKKFYNRWIQICQNDLLYKRCKAVAQLFQHCQKSVDQIASPILVKKQYNLGNIQKLQGFFSKVIDTHTSNLKSTLNTLKANAE